MAETPLGYVVSVPGGPAAYRGLVHWSLTTARNAKNAAASRVAKEEGQILALVPATEGVGDHLVGYVIARRFKDGAEVFRGRLYPMTPKGLARAEGALERITWHNRAGWKLTTVTVAEVPCA